LKLGDVAKQDRDHLVSSCDAKAAPRKKVVLDVGDQQGVTWTQGKI
jgi:hypothetical protein